MMNAALIRSHLLLLMLALSVPQETPLKVLPAPGGNWAVGGLA